MQRCFYKVYNTIGYITIDFYITIGYNFNIKQAITSDRACNTRTNQRSFIEQWRVLTNVSNNG